MTTKERPDLPIFRLYSLEDLERLLCPGFYSLTTIVSIRQGDQPATRRFRRVVAQALGRSEAELFGPMEEEKAEGIEKNPQPK